MDVRCEVSVSIVHDKLDSLCFRAEYLRRYMIDGMNESIGK